MSKPMSHDEAIDALCGCAATVTVLSYQEAIEGYFKLRELPIPGPSTPDDRSLGDDGKETLPDLNLSSPTPEGDE